MKFIGRLLGSTKYPSSGRNTNSQTYGHEIRVLHGHDGPVKFLLAIDENRILSAGVDGKIIMWDSRSGARLCFLSGHTTEITAIHLFDFNTLISTSIDGQLRVWHLSTRTPSIPYPTTHTSPVSFILSLPNFSLPEQMDGSASSLSASGAKSSGSDTRMFCTGASDMFLNIWDINGRILLRLKRQEDFEKLNSVLAISDSRIVCATDSPEISVYSLTLGQYDKHHGHQSAVVGLVNLPGKVFASASSDGSIWIWKAGPSEPVTPFRELLKQAMPITHIQTTGKKYLVVVVKSGFYVIHSETGRVIAKQLNIGTSSDVKSIIPLQGGRQVVTAVGDPELYLWEAERVNEMLTSSSPSLPKKLEMSSMSVLHGHMKGVTTLLYMDFLTFASGGADGYVLIWSDQRQANINRNISAARSLSFHSHANGKTEKSFDLSKAKSDGDVISSGSTPNVSPETDVCIYWEFVSTNQSMSTTTSAISSTLNPRYSSYEFADSVTHRRLGTGLSGSYDGTPDDIVLLRRTRSSSERRHSSANFGSEGDKLDDFDCAEVSPFPLLGDTLSKNLTHSYPICGLCEGTEEQEMITSKVREAVAILRVNKFTNRMIRGVFEIDLGHSRAFVELLEAFLKKNKA